MNYVIADASEALLPQIQRIEQQSFTVPWTEQMLRMQLAPDSHVFLTAETAEGVVGYIGMMYVLDEGYISNVAVRPDHRRQGVADALLDALEARARILLLSFLTLEVRAGNTPAIALYAKHGYRVAGRRRNYYEKPTEDALLMTLTLTEERETP